MLILFGIIFILGSLIICLSSEKPQYYKIVGKILYQKFCFNQIKKERLKHLKTILNLIDDQDFKLIEGLISKRQYDQNMSELKDLQYKFWQNKMNIDENHINLLQQLKSKTTVKNDFKLFNDPRSNYPPVQVVEFPLSPKDL